MNIGNRVKMTDSDHEFDYTYADNIFETSLKPLRSRYARTIYWIFLQNRYSEYLTTLDIQNALEYYEYSLSKKEINASLKALSIEGILCKDEGRGKPTTTNYDGKYTYDKWRLTNIGLLLSQSIRSMVETFNVEKKTHKSITNIETQILASLKNINEITLNEIADSVLKKLLLNVLMINILKLFIRKKTY